MPSVLVSSPFNPAATFRVSSRNSPPILDFYHRRVLVLHLTYDGVRDLPTLNWVDTQPVGRHSELASYRDLSRVAFDMATGFPNHGNINLTTISEYIGAMGFVTQISDD